MRKLACFATVKLLILSSVLLASTTGDNRPQQPFDPSEFTTGKFKSCKPEGTTGDPYLNQLKNRDLPPSSFKTMTVGEVVANKPTEALKQKQHSARENWPEEARADVEDFESQGIKVTGYIVGYRVEKPEGCNCKSESQLDTHLWLAENPDHKATKTKKGAMVVEISPRMKGNHKRWNTTQIAALRKDQTQVRVSGWMMWDQEHKSEVGKSRATLWEIHPIHQIEVKQGNKWVPLDELK